MLARPFSIHSFVSSGESLLKAFFTDSLMKYTILFCIQGWIDEYSKNTKEPFGWAMGAIHKAVKMG